MTSSASVGLSYTSKMSTAAPFSILQLLFFIICIYQGKGKPQCCPFPRLAFRPHASTLFHNETPDDGQPDAGTLEFVHAVQAQEQAEQLVNIGHVETGAIIADGINIFFAISVAIYLNHCQFAFTSELDGIVEQILQHLTHGSKVATGCGQICQAEFDGAPCPLGFEFLPNLPYQGVHVDAGQ